MKWAKISGVVTYSQGKTVLVQGKTVADDDHPLVMERPDLWSDDPPDRVDLAGPRRLAQQRTVTATARPGRGRSVRRG